MPYIETPDEIPIYYEDEGPRTSTGIFLIHAEPFNSRLWQKNIPELSSRFRVVATDTRGRGESGKTDDGHNVAQYAMDFRHVMETLGLQRVVAVGWSIGGIIVLNYMQQFGEHRLAGYVNVDRSPYRFVSEEIFRAELAAKKARRLRHEREFVLNCLGPEAQDDEEAVRWLTYQCMKTPTSAACDAFDEAYHADYRSFLNQVELPAAVFWCRYGLITTEMANFMNDEMPNSRLVYFEHSGHLLPWTEPERFNRELMSFAEEVLTV